MPTFRTTLWSAGGNNVGIVVPDEILASFGAGKRVPLVVTIDGRYSYRTTTAMMGGKNSSRSTPTPVRRPAGVRVMRSR
jgi:hypothetical protein